MKSPVIKAAIFDMDGLLVDSEPYWRKSHVRALSDIGVHITENDVREVAGMRPEEAVSYWYSRYPWNKPSLEEVTYSVILSVVHLIENDCKPLKGVYEIIELLSCLNISLAVASSSPMKIINVVMDKLKLANKVQVICSAEYEQYGKPHPGIYITTASNLGIKPEDCLVFEDAPNGVLAAKAAKMKCVAVPDPVMIRDKRFCIADMVINSLDEFSENDLLLLSDI